MNTIRHRTARNNHGFTLVEVMITLVVIAIVAALASPAFLAMGPDMRLRTAGNDLHAQLQRAKATAVKRNRNVGFTVTSVDCTVANFLDNFPQNGGSFQIFIDDGGGVNPLLANNNAWDPYEDVNGNGILDAGEDTNGNGVLDEELLKSVNDAPGSQDPAGRDDDLPESVALCNQDFNPPAPALSGSSGFTPTGLVSNAANGDLNLMSTQGTQYQITISPAGGVDLQKL